MAASRRHRDIRGFRGRQYCPRHRNHRLPLRAIVRVPAAQRAPLAERGRSVAYYGIRTYGDDEEAAARVGLCVAATTPPRSARRYLAARARHEESAPASRKRFSHAASRQSRRRRPRCRSTGRGSGCGAGFAAGINRTMRRIATAVPHGCPWRPWKSLARAMFRVLAAVRPPARLWRNIPAIRRASPAGSPADLTRSALQMCGERGLHLVRALGRNDDDVLAMLWQPASRVVVAVL